MAKQNLATKQYPNLPDAPAIVTVRSYEDESPYHVGTESKEQEYRILAQIRLMAITFVVDFSSKVEGKLDFSTRSLELVDGIIESFESTKPEDLEVFVAQCGSYIGLILENYTREKGKWHCSWPKYFFSGFRPPFMVETKGGKKKALVETGPYAAVAKRVLEVLGKGYSGSPEMKKYVSWVLAGLKESEN